MKKIIAILLLLASIFALASCNKDKEYPPVESTEEEARTVMTLSIDGKTYDVRYELYRAFFLTYKAEVDGGDESVWTGQKKDEYVAKIDELILERVAEIYAAFAICERIGFDLYSDDVEDKIKENIRISVEGGSYGSAVIEGFESYDDYLASLKAINLNYSVQTLLFRYAIAVDAIDTYYIGTASSDDVDINLTVGKIEYTKEDVKEFYDSDECVRVLRASFQKKISYTPLEKAENLKAALESAAQSKDTLEEMEAAVVTAIMGNGLYSNAAEIRDGYVIGRYNLERSYYGEMTDAAFALNMGEVSAPIEVVTDVEDSYYVLYRSYKSDEHFEENYDSIRYVYLMNYVGEISHGVAEELKSSVTYTDYLKGIDHSGIGM
ncbi:MAG: peptidylprolyl isomerase [Clostridia bacterium]|nr:peptidylprolyl isomerase [Clostridia bacterium]